MQAGTNLDNYMSVIYDVLMSLDFHGNGNTNSE